MSPATEVVVAPNVNAVLPSVSPALASAEFGIDDALTDKVGVVVLVATLGTSHVGQDPAEAIKFVTEPPPELEPVIVHVVVPPEKVQLPAPALKPSTRWPGLVFTSVTTAGAE